MSEWPLGTENPHPHPVGNPPDGLTPYEREHADHHRAEAALLMVVAERDRTIVALAEALESIKRQGDGYLGGLVEPARILLRAHRDQVKPVLAEHQDVIQKAREAS